MQPATNPCPACDGSGCYHVNGFKLDTCQVCEGSGISKTKQRAPRCEKCGAWLHETEQRHGCIMCQAEGAK